LHAPEPANVYSGAQPPPARREGGPKAARIQVRGGLAAAPIREKTWAGLLGYFSRGGPFRANRVQAFWGRGEKLNHLRPPGVMANGGKGPSPVFIEKSRAPFVLPGF